MVAVSVMTAVPDGNSNAQVHRSYVRAPVCSVSSGTCLSLVLKVKNVAIQSESALRLNG